MPKPYPQEFRDDVVVVARKGQAPLKQIAKDFGISEGCLHGWMKKADAPAAVGARGAIDRTVGILIGRAGGSANEALGRLRAMSMNVRQPLAVVAQQLVDETIRRNRAHR